MRASLFILVAAFLGLLAGCESSTTPVRDGQFPQTGQPKATESAAKMISPLTN